MTHFNLVAFFATSSLALIGACGSSPTPVARVASAEAAIRAAGESGAKQVPDAALHLHYAEQQRTEGQRLLNAGDNEQAAMQFRRAEADANLAVALAHQSAAQDTAQGATGAIGPDNTPDKQPMRPYSNSSDRSQ